MAAAAEPRIRAAGDPMLPRIVRVRKRVRELPGTVSLTFEAADGGTLPPFQPGQFTMLSVFGAGEIPVSISGDSADESFLVQTVRAVGAVSEAVAALRPGDCPGLRGPFGSAWPIEDLDGRDVVMVAGGLGLAALRSAVYHVLANRARFGTVVLLYGTRSPEDILFRGQLQTWRKRLDVQLEVTVDHAERAWRGHVGVVTLLLPRLAVDAARTTALVCGPEVMMRFVAAGLGDIGVAESSIWVSLERTMQCGIGLCGHCQFGGMFVCKDGPVLRYDRVRPLLGVKEL